MRFSVLLHLFFFFFSIKLIGFDEFIRAAFDIKYARVLFVVVVFEEREDWRRNLMQNVPQSLNAILIIIAMRRTFFLIGAWHYSCGLLLTLLLRADVVEVLRVGCVVELSSAVNSVPTVRPVKDRRGKIILIDRATVMIQKRTKDATTAGLAHGGVNSQRAGDGSKVWYPQTVLELIEALLPHMRDRHRVAAAAVIVDSQVKIDVAAAVCGNRRGGLEVSGRTSPCGEVHTKNALFNNVPPEQRGR